MLLGVLLRLRPTVELPLVMTVEPLPIIGMPHSDKRYTGYRVDTE